MSRLEVSFERILVDKDSNTSRSLVRFNNMFIDKRKKCSKRFYRREPVKIINKTNGQWSIAFASGSAGIKGLNRSSIQIDYDTADMLGLSMSNESCSLCVMRANPLDMLIWYLHHPEHHVMFNTRITVVAFALGLISFAITFA